MNHCLGLHQQVLQNSKTPPLVKAKYYVGQMAAIFFFFSAVWGNLADYILPENLIVRWNGPLDRLEVLHILQFWPKGEWGVSNRRLGLVTHVKLLIFFYTFDVNKVLSLTGNPKK